MVMVMVMVMGMVTMGMVDENGGIRGNKGGRRGKKEAKKKKKGEPGTCYIIVTHILFSFFASMDNQEREKKEFFF